MQEFLKVRCNKDNKIKPAHAYKKPSQNFFQEGLMCSGREHIKFPNNFQSDMAYS